MQACTLLPRAARSAPRTSGRSTPTGTRWPPPRARKLADREGGLVRVGAFTSVSIEWFPSIARAFLDQYPKIDLKLLCIDDEEELVNAVWEGRADCAFSIAPERRNLEAVPLHTDPLLVVLPPNHPLAGAPFFPTERLSPQPYVQLRDGARAPEMEALFRPTTASPNVRFTVDSITPSCPMVSAGLGFSVPPSLILSRPLFPARRAARPSTSAPAASRSPCARATPPQPPPAPSPKSPENGWPTATGDKSQIALALSKHRKGPTQRPLSRGREKCSLRPRIPRWQHFCPLCARRCSNLQRKRRYRNSQFQGYRSHCGPQNKVPEWVCRPWLRAPEHRY